MGRTGLAILFVMLVGGCVARVPGPYEGWFNPLPPSDEVAGYGRKLFRVHCTACHGVYADGRGPMAPSLQTRPTDLRTLQLAEVQIYESISLGKGESMPAFRNRLSVHERAALVRYLERISSNTSW